MPRPRTHDLDDLLDVAEQIVTGSGAEGLTLRGLAVTAGVSNGSIYHAFSSKDDLLVRLWIRAAERLFAAQAPEVEAVLAGDADPVDAVVAAALAPVSFARDHPSAARLFLAQRPDQLFSDALPQAAVVELAELQQRFTALLVRLAKAVWQRRDKAAVDAIAACVVDLPGGLVRRRLLADDGPDDQVAARIEASVRAVLALPLPPRRTRRGVVRREDG